MPFTLPYSRLLLNVSDLYWQTSWPFDRRVAIAPEIYTPPTFAAYRANRDPALEAILGNLSRALATSPSKGRTMVYSSIPPPCVRSCWTS